MSAAAGAEELRGYQKSAIEQARVALRKGLKRFVLYAPTGAGKTVLAEQLIRNARAKGKRVAFLVNRVSLVKQTSSRFLKGGISHGIMQGSNSCNTHADVLVGCIKTVAKRGLPPVDLVIIDEGHGVAGSVEYRELIFAYNNVPVIALTATPFSSGMAKPYPQLGGEPLFQDIVVAATIRELIEMGYLVDCEIYAPSEPDLSEVKLQRNQFGELDYSEKDLGKAVDKASLIGDIITHWKRMANNKPTVCFATNIAHSKHIVEQFELAGVSARHIDCYMDEDEKDQILKDFKAGKFKVLSNVSLIAEGFDHPETEVMILARPTKSLIRWIQMVGRVLRPFPGKTRGLILDHSGSAHLLGYPTEDLPLELCDGSVKESKPKSAADKEKDEAAAKEKKCPKCHFIKPPGTHECPKCGFKPERKNEVVTEEGELQLVDRSKKAELSKTNKQEIYSQLLHVQKERGYSDGWLGNQYREIFGVWPRGLDAVTLPPTIEVRRWLKHQTIKFARGKEAANRAAAAA